MAHSHHRQTRLVCPGGAGRAGGARSGHQQCGPCSLPHRPHPALLHTPSIITGKGVRSGGGGRRVSACENRDNFILTQGYRPVGIWPSLGNNISAHSASRGKSHWRLYASTTKPSGTDGHNAERIGRAARVGDERATDGGRDSRDSPL